MGRAYGGNGARQLALELERGRARVPPLGTRIHCWQYDRKLYKRRNEIERLFRRLKGFRFILPRLEKLDVMLLGFIVSVPVFNALR